MAIRIKCQQCSRRISIDEAFAGGMCRCPYCKAITLVPESAGESDSPRPASPTERPSAPPPGRPMAPPEGGHHPASQRIDATSGPASSRIPTAHRVAVQGLIGLIGVVLLIVLMAVLLFQAYRHFASPGKSARTGGATPSLQTDAPVQGANVVGMKLAGPVVYCIDGTMGEQSFDIASAIVRHSVQSLSPQDRFSILLWRGDGPTALGAGWTAGGPDGQQLAGQFLDAAQPSGASDPVKGLQAAIDLSPGSIVVLAGKELAGVDSLAGDCKSKGIVVDTVCVVGDADVEKALAKLAGQTGGASRGFLAVQEWLRDAPPLSQEPSAER